MIKAIFFILESINHAAWWLLSDTLQKLNVLNYNSKISLSYCQNLASREVLPVVDENNQIISADFADGESCETVQDVNLCSYLKNVYNKIKYYDGYFITWNSPQDIDYFIFPKSYYYSLAKTNIILYTALFISLIAFFRNPIKRSLTIINNLILDIQNTFNTKRINN